MMRDVEHLKKSEGLDTKVQMLQLLVGLAVAVAGAVVAAAAAAAAAGADGAASVVDLVRQWHLTGSIPMKSIYVIPESLLRNSKSNLPTNTVCITTAFT